MNQPVMLYGFLLAMGLFVVCWFAFVVPSERRDHQRRLALVQKRIAEREERRLWQADAGDRHTVTGAESRDAAVLETARLTLREMTVDDAAFVLSIVNDADFLRYIGDRGVRSIADAREYILRGPVDSYRRHGYGMYLAALKSDGSTAGMCGLVRREGLDGPDIGFAFLPQFRFQGYATEATAAALRYGREILRLRRILAIAAPDNVASKRILAKAGMRLDGTLRLPGDDTELNLYVYGT